MTYRFGRFVLDADTRQLLDDGREIHLSPKAFELLALLLDNRARVVPKAELLDRLWPSTFVEEANLATLVAEIRRALRDSATEPVFLRTVYRFGYRFVGEAVETGGPRAPAGERPYLISDNRQVMLMEGANVIGRDPDATIHCDVTGVSRRHAQILLANGEATLEDLGSKNGTFLRREHIERITSARLNDGDEIRLGKACFTFRVRPAIGRTQTVSIEDPSQPKR